MLLLLALLGCNPESVVDPSIGNGPVPPDRGTTHAAAAPQHLIATKVARLDRPARRMPPPPKTPDGQAVYTDCGAGPWYADRGGNRASGEPEMDAEPPPPPTRRSVPSIKRPKSRPAYKPAPQPAPAATPTAGQTASGPAKDGGSTPPPVVVGGAIGGEASGAASGVAGSGSASRTEIGQVGSGRSGYGAGDSRSNDGTVAAPKGAEAQEKVVGHRDATRELAKNEEGRKQLDQLGYAGDEEAGGDYYRTPVTEDKKKGRNAQLEADLSDGDGNADPAKLIAEPIAEPADEAKPFEDADDIAEIDEATEEEEAQNSRFWDWGARVHLSNDDSMSLASAQRVLYQVMNGRRPKLSEIRPHELLNYFSFDTVPVPDNQLFSVLGAGEQVGDTLSVAMAVQGGVPVRQPLDLTLVVDRSGSMAAEGRMSYTRRGLEQMADQLQPGDRIDLVLFESRVCTTLQDYVVGRDDPELLKHAMNSLKPMGSTDLDGGLKEAYRVQKSRSEAQTHGRNRRVMLITDAFLNTGAVDANVVSQIGTSFDEDNIRLTGVGVGRDFNDEVLDKLTEKGKGAYVYLGSEAVVDRVFGSSFDSLVRTIAHDVRFSLDLPPSLAMERFYGEEASTDAADIQPINYYAGTSQVFLQDLHIKGDSLVLDDPVTMRIEWRDAATGEPDALELHTTVGALVDGDRRNLHKAQALMAWSDWTTAWAMGADTCGQVMDGYAETVAKIDDDAELSFLSGLVQQTCGRPVVATAPVAYKVRVDSDIPIAEVGLYCRGKSWSERLGGGDTIARFDDAKPGACTLTLHGNVAMQTSVDVPETGGDVRCTIRGGRMSCG